jgi:hypothetical protein
MEKPLSMVIPLDINWRNREQFALQATKDVFG